MTERYNSKTVDSSLVLFSEPTTVEGLHYYDFDTKSWRPVQVIKKLPYNLYSYRFLDESNPGEKDCIVTCEDSYRLCDCQYDHTEHDPDIVNEQMNEQRIWRDDLVKSGAECEYYHEKQQKVYYAKVCWVKSDIIPGVVLVGHRSMPNVNSFGYIYKESNKFFPIGSYLPIISNEQLEKETQDKERSEKITVSRKLITNEWKSKLDYCTCKKYKDTSFGMVGPVNFWNLLPLYESLSKYRDEITLQDVNTWIKENNKETKEIECINNISDLLALGFASIAQKYDMCYTSDEIMVQKEWKASEYVVYSPEGIENAKKQFKPSALVPNFCDLYFDIVVHGATYASLWCGDGYPGDGDLYNREFKLVKIDNIFTFPDITIDNPLFRALTGSTYRIYTDGDKVSYNGAWLNENSRILMHSAFGNSWMINKIQGKYLLSGHMWAPSLSFPEEDLIIIDKPIITDKPEKTSSWSITKVYN